MNYSISKFVTEALSNKKVMVPPGTSSMGGVSIACMASKSIIDRISFVWFFGVPSRAGVQTLLRMSSWIESWTQGFKQFKCFHSLRAASPSFLFCISYLNNVRSWKFVWKMTHTASSTELDFSFVTSEAATKPGQCSSCFISESRSSSKPPFSLSHPHWSRSWVLQPVFRCTRNISRSWWPLSDMKS